MLPLKLLTKKFTSGEKGFTLIELLVVIAAIASLICILLVVVCHLRGDCP
jgi:prepilin-type N-terminal cleavage/methylation domain-containing protein